MKNKLKYVLSFRQILFYFLVGSFLIQACKKQGSDTILVYREDIKGIQYATWEDSTGSIQPLLMDVYFPYEMISGKKYPLVLFMHGGSFIMGDREAVSGICLYLADSGFIVASIDYRLGWDYQDNCKSDPYEIEKALYKGIQDSRAALRFLVNYSDELSIDTSWVFSAGMSAGGMIALNGWYTNDSFWNARDYRLKEIFGQLDFHGNQLFNTFQVKGICNCWGSLIDSTLINKGNAIPAISFHGMEDQVIPVDTGFFLSCSNYPASYGSICIHRRLSSFSAPALSWLLPGRGHSPNDSYTDEFIAKRAACFFHQLMNGTAHSEVITGTSGGCSN